MPLINGVKMACITAAIPRKQKCGCGSSTAGTPTESSSSSSVVKAESPASDAPPMSPTKAPTASFRVQKSTSKSSSRKQSFDPAALERMDAAHVNVLPPYDMAQPGPVPHANVMPGMPAPRPGMEYGAMPMMGAVSGGFHQPIMYPMFSQQMPGAMYPPVSTMGLPHMNGSMSTPSATPMTPSPAQANTTNGGGSCCSTSAKASTPVAPAKAAASTGGSCCSGSKKSEGTSASSSVASSPKAETKPKAGGGCCSSKAPPINTNVAGNGHMNSHMSPNDMVVSPFQTPVAVPQGMYQSYFQPTVFTYPPQYGSYMSPLQPAQWRQTMEALQYGQPTPQPPGFNMSAPLGFVPEGAVPDPTSHVCSCGNGCQCVGCAAHPYNDATQEYVRSAYMYEDSYATTNGRGSTNGTNGHSEAATNGNGLHGTETNANGENGGSPPGPQTPSDAASGLSDEQPLSASDFFFVTYTGFGMDGCAGETSSCPCGDDCQCLGCSIHNNPPPPVPDT
ncbi:Protein GRISEA [Colletotrichum trifolii]|uniref:Protein GRISEA n=1 Tax=Colletotrichum trifolii TaxID=5466 RepID=A0A4R8R6Q7_COLTR|nr:Protein GRISEA [Colletotrichum trifolii]